MKNNESNETMVVDAVAVGIGAGSFSDNVEIFIRRNPDAGDIVTDATAADMKSNANFGSNDTFDADVFKGKSGGTMTGHTDHAIIAQNGQGRVFATVPLVVPRGSTVGVYINPNLSSGSVEVYAAFIGFFHTAE